MIVARIRLTAEVGLPDQSAYMTCSRLMQVAAHQQHFMDLQSTLWVVVPRGIYRVFYINHLLRFDSAVPPTRTS